MDIHRCGFVDYTPASITSSAFSHESNKLEFTPKSLRLAVGRADGSIEIWNPNNSHSKWLLENTIYGGEGRSVEGLIWSYKNDLDSSPRLFSIGGSTFLTEWDLEKGIPLKNHDCNAGIIWSVSINKSQNKIAVGCDDGSVVVVDIAGGRGVLEHEKILQRQKSRVLSLCWINDDLIIGGCADGRIRCWNYKKNDESNGRLIQTLRVDKSKSESTLIWSLLPLTETNQFVSGDSTGSIKIWDVKHFVLQQSLKVHEADVLCLTKDFTGKKLFSAGVDRKIFNFNFTTISKNNSKWINTTNRLLHGNDIRTMSSFESKNADYLISGGVERSIHINSIENFQNSVSFKLPINTLNQNILVNSEKRFLINWQGKQVKIWKFNLDRTKKLISKLSLSDSENITSVAISKNGRYLVVARLSTIKLFELVELEKLQVFKIESELLSSIGAKLIRFVDEQNLIVACTMDNEIVSFKFNTNDDEDDSNELSMFDDSQSLLEYEMPDDESITQNSNNSYKYLSNYTQFSVNNDGTFAALSKFNGSIDILNLETRKSFNLIHMNNIPTCISFTGTNTLITVSLDHKIHEFNVSNTDSQLYTTWSLQNSENMPAQFISLLGQAYGVFENLGRFWVYGSNWLCFFDSHYSLIKQSQTIENKKRNRNGSSVSNSNSNVNGNSNGNANQETDKCFWLTHNYKDLLFVGKLSDSELVVVERHLEDMPITPAFKWNKITV